MTVVLKYALLTYAVIAYGVLLGDNWHWYAMALMLAAIRSHYVRTVASDRRAMARVPRGRRRHERSKPGRGALTLGRHRPALDVRQDAPDRDQGMGRR